jgi:hypothetical protein
MSAPETETVIESVFSEITFDWTVGEALFVEHCKPILGSFLANTQDLPLRPGKTDYPQLPDNCAFGGLRDLMRESIDRVMAMADTPKARKPSRVEDALAVLSRMHAEVYSATVLRLKHAGKRINDTAIRQRGDGLSRKCCTNSTSKPITDIRGSFEAVCLKLTIPITSLSCSAKWLVSYAGTRGLNAWKFAGTSGRTGQRSTTPLWPN